MTELARDAHSGRRSMPRGQFLTVHPVGDQSLRMLGVGYAVVILRGRTTEKQTDNGLRVFPLLFPVCADGRNVGLRESRGSAHDEACAVGKTVARLPGKTHVLDRMA
jgi:hypothetical protein